MPEVRYVMEHPSGHPNPKIKLGHRTRSGVIGANENYPKWRFSSLNRRRKKLLSYFCVIFNKIKERKLMELFLHFFLSSSLFFGLLGDWYFVYRFVVKNNCPKFFNKKTAVHQSIQNLMIQKEKNGVSGPPALSLGKIRFLKIVAFTPIS